MTSTPSSPGTPSDAAPTFSFLTTAYRAEGVVGRAIESVLAQTRDDWEMVVVDNGMSDALVAVVEPYLSDPRLQLVRQENQGASGGTAAAAARAVGDYLVVLNSDDYVAPHFLEQVAATLRDHPEAVAVACDAGLFVDPGARAIGSSYLRRAGMVRTPDPARPLDVADVIDGPCPYYTAPIRREVWHALGGMSTLAGDASRVDDLDFWLRALTAGHDVRMIPDRLAFFRIEAGSVSRPNDAAASEEFETQLEQSLRRAAERSGEETARVALASALRRLHYWQALRRARVALRTGDGKEAARQYAVALRQRRSPRVAAYHLALRVAPGLVLLLYRVRRAGAVLGERVLRHRRLQDWRMRFGHDV